MALGCLAASAAPFAYITNQSDNNVSVIDTASDTVVATVAVGSAPVAVAVNPAGTRVYVANRYSDSVSVIATANNTVVATVAVGTQPLGVAVNPAGTRAYVTNSSSNNVSVIDTANNTVIATVAVGVNPIGVAVNPAGTRVYVVNQTANNPVQGNVSVIDTANNTVVATIAVEGLPIGVAINPTGTRAYVTNYNGATSNSVSVIDTASNTVVATVPVGLQPYAVAVNPAGTRAYISNVGSNDVSVIDAASNTVVATVPVGVAPTGVAVNPAGTRAYVPNSSSASVSVIDTASDTVVATVTVGISPGAFGLFIGPPSHGTLVFGPDARIQFESFVTDAGDTFIDFESLPAGTDLTTQLSGLGVTFASNISTSGTPFGPVHVEVSTAFLSTRGLTIVGSPCDGGCVDDGRVGYEIVFATPQRRAGLLRIWNTQTLTQFYNQSGALLAEHVNTVGTEFVGFIADGANPSTDWVKRIQIDTVAPSSSRQVGYSDDLFFGSAEIGSTFTPSLESGFNLLGNSLDLTLDVAAIFGNQDAPVSGITENIVSIWKWNAVQGRWAFYSPQLTASGIASFAASKGYEVLSVIGAGEGYWVNAAGAMTLPAQTGTGFSYTPSSFSALPSGFNLIAHAGTVSPSQFNLGMSATPPAEGVVPTDNFVSLWAWDALQGKWYFYSPLLEASGGLAAVKSHADSNFYLHFEDHGKQIEIGTGFWVNRP